MAALLGLSVRAVRDIEKRALAKLRRHPTLRDLWREYEALCNESQVTGGLTGPEIVALFDLADTDEERGALRHLLQTSAGRAGSIGAQG